MYCPTPPHYAIHRNQQTILHLHVTVMAAITLFFNRNLLWHKVVTYDYRVFQLINIFGDISNVSHVSHKYFTEKYFFVVVDNANLFGGRI